MANLYKNCVGLFFNLANIDFLTKGYARISLGSGVCEDHWRLATTAVKPPLLRAKRRASRSFFFASSTCLSSCSAASFASASALAWASFFCFRASASLRLASLSSASCLSRASLRRLSRSCAGIYIFEDRNDKHRNRHMVMPCVAPIESTYKQSHIGHKRKDSLIS